jgi:hypothetical protein
MPVAIRSSAPAAADTRCTPFPPHAAPRSRSLLASNPKAAHLLEVLGEMYELQLDVDAITKTHVPINFARVERVLTALAIRRVAKIMAEENDHTLDSQALSATKSLTEQK